MKLIDALKVIKEDAPIKQCGICSNMVELEVGYDEARPAYELMKKWPKYSGDSDFPVPGKANAYFKAQDESTMYSKTTRYGRLRHDLLNYMIKELE